MTKPDLDPRTLPVHQAAVVWPLLTDSEMDALGRSIQDVGLLQPVIVWQDSDGTWWLLDGRNRVQACERIGTVPEYTVYEGDNPALYVLAANEHRRHSTPSQRAMAVALTVTTNSKGGKPGKNAELTTNEDAATQAGTSERLVRMCRYVRDHAPELVDAVLAGTIKAAAAEAEAKRLVNARAEMVEDFHLDIDAELLDAMQRDAPDLADKYAEEEADIHDVSAEYEARIKQAFIHIKSWNDAANEIRKHCRNLDGINTDSGQRILQLAAPNDPGRAHELDRDALAELIAAMTDTTNRLEKFLNA